MGDAVAFEMLIESYQKRIFSIAYRMTQNTEDATDMTQEVLVKIFKNLHQFKGEAKFSTWVYRVATNTCLDEVKRYRRHQHYSLNQEIETEEGSMATTVADDAPGPEEMTEKKMLHHAMHTVIAQLSDEHQRVILLRDIQGLSYEEIAAVLRCSVGTVKSRISRARRSLKKLIEKNRELFSDYFV